MGGIENYIDFMHEGIDDEIKKFYDRSILPTILGNKPFKKTALQNVKIKNIQSSSADIKRIMTLPEIKWIGISKAIFIN